MFFLDVIITFRGGGIPYELFQFVVVTCFSEIFAENIIIINCICKIIINCFQEKYEGRGKLARRDLTLIAVAIGDKLANDLKALI